MTTRALALALVLIACAPRSPRPQTLVPIATALPRDGQWRESFDLADLDGDGHVDLLHAPARKSGNSPTLFRGPGFHATPLPPVSLSYGAALALDLDHDGHLDLAYALHHIGLVAMRTDGTPLPLPARATTFSSRALAALDGELIALADEPASPGLLHVPTSTIIPGSERLFGDHLSVGDIDDDHHDDVLLATGNIGDDTIACRGRPLTCGSLPVPAHARVTAVLAADAAFVASASFNRVTLQRDDETLIDEQGENLIVALAHLPHALALARADGSITVGDISYPAPRWRSGCEPSAMRVLGDTLIVAFATEPSRDRCPSGGGFEVLRLFASPP